MLHNKEINILHCIEMYHSGDTQKNVARYISDSLGIGISAAKERARKIWNDNFDEPYINPFKRVVQEGEGEIDSHVVIKDKVANQEPKTNTPKQNSSVFEFAQNFIYNNESDKYVFLTEKSFGKNLVFDGEKIRQIVKLYSNVNGKESSLNDISISMGIPRQYLTKILSVLQITHDSLPVTDEELMDKSSDDLLVEILSQKKFDLHQKIQKESWKRTQENSLAWERFCANTLEPIQGFLQNWKPERYFPQVTNFNKPSHNEDKLIIGLSDLHYGSQAIGDYMVRGKSWDIDRTVLAVERYSEKIIQLQAKEGYKELHILFLGDILDSLTGYTDKGTKLDTNPIGVKQFEIALESLRRFFVDMVENFPSVKVYCVGGNHSNFGDLALAHVLSSYFRLDSTISFKISSCRWTDFTIDNNFFVIDHGKSHLFKNEVPHDGKGRESYINKLLLTRRNQIVGKNLYYICGDKHHVESQETSHFEFFMFSTLIGGNQYADNNLWFNRPRQNGLTLHENGDISFRSFILELED